MLAEAPRPLDRRGVAALCGAVLVEDRGLLAERVDAAERVPGVRVAGHEPERAPHAATADQDRDALAHRRRIQLREALLDPWQRVLERRDPPADRAEVVAVLV